MPASRSPAPCLNIGLLERLRQAAGDYVPIAELAGDPAGAQSDLDALASFGFAIRLDRDRGAAYLGPAGRLCPDQIEHQLGTRRIGRRIAVWDRASSTNDLAAGARSSQSNDGLVVLADEQTAGRGRLGRSWIAPPRSSVLMSVLLFPPRELDAEGPGLGPAVAWLTAMAAVATAEVVSGWIARPAAIKWPNDVRVDRRKIAGILVERPAAGPLRPAVIGIGLNVNVDPQAFPPDLRPRATSIRIERDGLTADRSEIARDLIRRLDHWYEAARSVGHAALAAPWRERSEHLGRVVRIETPAGLRSGRVVDLDLRLGLTLETIPEHGRGPGPPSDGPATDQELVRVAAAEILSIDEPAAEGT